MSGSRRKALGDAVTVSAFFTSTDAVERAVEVLLAAGTPRDLVDVVVGPQAAARFYEGRVRRLGTLAVPYAAKGALIGLFTSIALSLYILILPGFEVPRHVALVQLLGPNLGAVIGGILGAAIGALRPRSAVGAHARALERDAILLVVLERRRDHAPVVSRALSDLGGEDVCVDDLDDTLSAAATHALQP